MGNLKLSDDDHANALDESAGCALNIIMLMESIELECKFEVSLSSILDFVYFAV